MKFGRLSKRLSKRSTPLMAAAAVFCGLVLAGCDEHVEVIQDTDIHVMKRQTWAWRPMQTPHAQASGQASGERPVISRDVIGRHETVTTEADPAVEISRRQLRTEIERQMTQKGLTEVSDASVADYLVDYHFAVRGHNMTVQSVYPGYPGLVCGPFGCWQGWGYGPPEVAYQNVQFREGTFVFDMTQNVSKHLVYRAIGQEPAYHAQFSHDQIEDMVHALLKKLKVRG